jgi:hypothetical protein
MATSGIPLWPWAGSSPRLLPAPETIAMRLGPSFLAGGADARSGNAPCWALPTPSLGEKGVATTMAGQRRLALGEAPSGLILRPNNSSLCPTSS